MRRSKLITQLAALTLIGAALLPVAGVGTAATASAAITNACATPSCIPDMDANAHESVAANPSSSNADNILGSINYNASKSNTGNLTGMNSTVGCPSPGACDGAAKGQADG